VTGIGHAIGGMNAALSLALPTARYSRHDLPRYVEALRVAATRIEREVQFVGEGLAS
jgi:DNA-binding IclR family transcriptional regulator